MGFICVAVFWGNELKINGTGTTAKMFYFHA
jgi:hypothetical protein